MIAEIEREIQRKISELLADKRRAARLNDYDWSAECSSLIMGLEMSLEIIYQCLANTGKMSSEISVAVLEAKDAELIMEMEKSEKMTV